MVLLAVVVALLGLVGWQCMPPPAPHGSGFQELTPALVGDKAVVLAGVAYDQATMKGLVIDLSTRESKLTASPELWWRTGYTAVATESHVIVWGGCLGPAGSGSRARAALYDVKADRWVPASAGPLGSRAAHTAVWAGREMIVWGGASCSGVGRSLADGAAYDPHAHSWRPIAASPLSPRLYHVAVWTGEEMLVWGGSDRRRLRLDGAAYDPERDEWRRLAATTLFEGGTLAPGDEPNLDAEWTGRQMTVWSRHGAAAYDPGADEWTPIPPPPAEIRDVTGGQTAWSGEELMVWGGSGGDGTNVQQGAAYDPDTGRWRALPDAPIRGRDRHAALSIPGGMLVWGGCCRRSGHYADGTIFQPSMGPRRLE